MLSEHELAEVTKDEYTSHPLKYLVKTIWIRGWVVALAAVVSTGLTLGVSLMQPSMYAASVEILVGQRSTDEIPEDAFDLQQLTQTMAETMHSRRVAEGVIQELNLRTTPENLLENMRVEQVKATQLIHVDYRDPNPQRAQEVADTIGKVFSEQISKASPSASSITTTLWEHAEIPERPVSPQPIRNSAIALGVGVMLGIVLAFLLDYLDDE
jgi:succinoglycan biosynthesis transport protein ExoP